jgi:hypothetical protein
MRVHPSIISPRASKWQLGAGVLVVLVIFCVAFFRSPSEKVIIKEGSAQLKEVVVARQAIDTGQPFDKAKLALEQRPVYTLPSDAITSLDLVKNKVAAGPIPAGYPLALALLAEPVPVLAPSDPTALSPSEDPIDSMLHEIEKDTVAVQVRFNNQVAPKRGARITILAARSMGDPIVVVEECWVASSEGTTATIRVEPSRALLIRSFSNNESFGFIQLSPSGENPYKGKGVKDKDELDRILSAKGGKIVESVKTENRRLKGYAWVPGEGIRYGLGDDGQIQVLESGASGPGQSGK